MNIGVIFAPRRGAPVFRLLPHARALGSLLGDDGGDNYALLLRVLHEQLQGAKSRREIPLVSPQALLTPWRVAAGNNPHEIADRLYGQVVTLAQCDPPATGPVDRYTVRTLDLRARVKKRLSTAASRAMLDEPVVLHGQDGKQHQIDMPIWSEPLGLFPQLRFGTIVSQHYRLSVYRRAELGPACQHFSMAIAHRPAQEKNAAGLFVSLRPADNTPGYSTALITDIENEFDSLTWGFQKSPGVRVCMAQSMDEATELVRELLQ
ncbi:MAG: hypothetical protein EOO27_04790 [Comamonadaceae bacterium]|nr:MAG: hypothetical protein EOO27_04790 [Comamonadaceae bacterium]